MAQTAQLRLIHTAENEAQRIFKLQREAYMRHPYPTLEERKASLTKVEKILIKIGARWEKILAQQGK